MVAELTSELASPRCVNLAGYTHSVRQLLALFHRAALLVTTVAFNVLLPQSPWFWPLFVLGNASIVQGMRILQLWPWW